MNYILLAGQDYCIDNLTAHLKKLYSNIVIYFGGGFNEFIS